MKNRGLNLLRDTIVIGFGSLFSKGIIFFLIPLQTAVMSTSDYGLAEMFYNLVNILVPIFTLGIAEAGMRFSITNVAKRKSVFQIITILPLFGYIMLASIVILCCTYYPEYRVYIIQLLLLYICFALRDIYLQFTKGINNLKLYSYGSILFSAVLFLLSYYFLVQKKAGISGYLNSYILANFITILFLLFYGNLKEYCNFSLKNIDKELFQSMIFYSLPLISNLLAWWITNLSNRYVLAYYCSLSDVGIYSALAKFSLIINTVFGVFFQSWQINAAQNIDMPVGRKEFFEKIHDYYLVSVVVFTAIFMIFSNFIASLFIRGNFAEAYQYLPGIIISGTACCLPMYWGAIYGALKNTKGAFRSTACGSIVSVFLNFILIPNYGINGAIIATIISYLVVVIYRVIDINRILLIDLNLKKHLLGMLVLLIQAFGIIHIDLTYVFILFNILICITLFLIYKNNFWKVIELIKR